MKRDNAPIRVLIVDDHDMVRRGLSVFLEAFEDLEFAGEASSGEEAVQKCAKLRPDVVLMDLIMPGMDGVAATRTILQANPRTRIIALTSFQEDELVRAALEAGATSYLQKNVSIDDLGDAIRKSYAGQRMLSPEATQALIALATQPTRPEYGLTRREREVLERLAAGLSNPEIAASLHVSPQTVKTHVSNILVKMGATSRAEAAARAVQMDLVKRGSDEKK